jgi:choline dehydrogenase-like flavoprotein
MHIDLNQLETAGSKQSPVCIIGGGIAGLLLAQRLARFGLEVSVLEAGGLELEARSQALYQAEMAAMQHLGSTEGRFRTFGGSSTRWGGELLPFSEDIFTPPAGSLSEPWPIREIEIKGYYEEIQRIMHLGPLPFTDALLPALGHVPVPFPLGIRLRYSKWAPFNKRNLAHTVGRECLAHPRIRLFTHANVAALHGEGERITSARVLDYKGRFFEVRADQFVVAAGAIESSRLLLASAHVPNEYDQLGRFFHDHLSLHAAVLPTAARSRIFDRLGPFFVNGVLHTCRMEATSELQREQGLLAVMAHFIVQEPEDSGIEAVRNVLVSIQRGNLTSAFTRNLVPMLRGSSDVVRLLWYSKVLGRRAVSTRAVVRLNIDMEQAATPSNRIRLSDNLDALGLRKAIVDWRVSNAEYETARRFARIIKQQLEAAGFAGLDWTPGLLDGLQPALVDSYHPMGGLRMGVDPATSVVDTNLKVHGVKNLYVASCAVYPSGGSSNPTFTLMALAMRLGDHLRSMFAGSARPKTVSLRSLVEVDR